MKYEQWVYIDNAQMYFKTDNTVTYLGLYKLEKKSQIEQN